MKMPLPFTPPHRRWRGRGCFSSFVVPYPGMAVSSCASVRALKSILHSRYHLGGFKVKPISRARRHDNKSCHATDCI